MKYKNYIAFLLLVLSLYSKPLLTAKETADYIVVGVGTAGATISKLLSDDNTTSVIALHNGKNLTQDPDIKFTRNAAFTVLSAPFGSPLYQTGDTLPQPNDDDNEILWVLALPEGGASSINAGAWARGTNQVYSQWEAIAGPEWSTTKILDLYKSLENYHGMTTDPSARGYNGPVDVRQIPIPTPFATKFNQAVATGTGVPIVVDYNVTSIGTSAQLQYTQSGADGEFRVSSATAFLNGSVVTPSGKGVGNRKLTIKYKSTSLRTIWEGNKAVGVEYFQDGKIKKAFANKGVIVCGGLYSSAFLLHSGVGPKDLLTSLGISVKFDNPNVGKALADQTIIPVVFATNLDDTPISIDNTCDSSENLPSGISFDLSNPSFLFNFPNSSNSNEQKRFLSTILCNGFAFPENSIFSQIAWLPSPGGDPTIRKVRISAVNPFPGIALALVDLVQPLSRGVITIDSFNPFDPPVIDSGMFNNPSDLNLYVNTFQTYIKNINNALHTMDDQYELIIPSPEILDDIELLTIFIKEAVTSSQCWQSHCRMAPLNQGGVVDSRGKVYGVENLYVADNSINPVLMDGTTMATAYLVAANIARLLLE